MGSAARRRALLEQVRLEGYVGTGGLAHQFEVDGSTIRRDLAHLERAGLIKRTRGGVLPAEPAAAVDVPYDVRRTANQAEKVAIANAAADLIENGQSVILDSGSTTYQLALALRRQKKEVLVVTNDLMIAVCLAGDPTVRVHVTGGSPIETAYTLVGPSTVAELERLHADWAFLGAEAVHHQAGITNINMVELPVKQAMINAAQQVAVIAASPSFGKRALMAVCGLDAISLLITDDGIADDERALYGSQLRTVSLTDG
ncbi:DeoR/GlpR family DNA-binding transcription regulator [Nonomuraea guangzhouensis]|uniref:DeoR/GlpR family DNA-binding transcription regulator n=1 Tax=Nonomuraea guangzhouensis TaxID=1291555 RepID=A0ABW4G661_9ACTN|nr:DeoR/GlpR family DNA-binding transcription regulator [Nonomuraea guangzhouensis]